MMRGRTMVVAVGAIVLIGLAAVVGIRSLAPADDLTVTPSPAEGTESAGTMPAAAARADSGEAPPPWAQQDDGTAPAESTAAPAEDRKRAQQMDQLQQTMGVLVDDALDRSEASNDHLRKALVTLEEMDDPAIKAQVNLAAVRHNLEVSIQMQALVRELQLRVAEPESPEREAHIAALKLQFLALQGQLRTDITPPGAPLPIPVPASEPAAR